MDLHVALQLDPSTADVESLRLALKAAMAALMQPGKATARDSVQPDAGKATAAAAAATSAGAGALLSLDQLRAMLRREDELRMSQEVQEAYRGVGKACMPCPTHGIVWLLLEAVNKVASPEGALFSAPFAASCCVLISSPMCRRPISEAELRDDTDWMEVTAEVQRRVMREFGVPPHRVLALPLAHAVRLGPLPCSQATVL